MDDRHQPLLLSEAYAELVGRPEGPISPRVLEHAASPHNMGVLKDPASRAVLTGICEDTVAVQLRLDGEKIEEIRFVTDGCGFTRACASMATELARGTNLHHALRIDGEQIIRALGGLPLEHTHCAHLAAATLKKAVQNALDARGGSPQR
jgi:nitrogen fixation NifU-like protein